MRWVMLGLLAIAVGALVTELVRRRQQRWLPLGLGFHFASCLIVALAAGWGRAPWGPGSVDPSRYTTAAAPTLLSLYFIWEACGPLRARPFGRAALCSLVFAFLALNWMRGAEEGWHHRQIQEAFRADVRAGMSIPQLVSRHAQATYYVHERLEDYLRLLRDHGYGEYRNLPADVSFRELHLTSPATTLRGAVWDGKAGRVTSNDPEIVFDLAHPMRIAGIRMKYSSANPGGWAPVLQVEWRAWDEEQSRMWHKYRHLFLKSGGREVVLPVWIYETVDRIRIRPDIRRCDFNLSDIVVLLPDSRGDPKPEDMVRTSQ